MDKYYADIQKFYDYIFVKPLSATQITLWFALHHIQAKCGQEWFTVANRTLESLTGSSRQSIYANRNTLKQNGLIDFRSNGTKATTYKITMLNILQDTLQIPLQNTCQDTLPNTYTLINKIDKLNYNKLNNLFYYLINKEEENFEEISEIDKQAIIFILKKLDIYLDEHTAEIINKELIIHYKIQYWCIKELYFSSFRVYLSELNTNFFCSKYQETINRILKKKDEKKILEEYLEDIVCYFIKTLKNEYIKK